MRKWKLLFALLITGFPVMRAFAQQAEAEASLSVNHIKIGEQLLLDLKIHYREGSKKAIVKWPVVKDTIQKGIEIIRIDTSAPILVDRATVLYEHAKKITITSFDSGMYKIAPFRFFVNGDTFYTDSLQLFVSSVPVDTTKDIKDIKNIYTVPPPPIVDEDSTTKWILFGVAALLLAGIILTIILLSRRKKKAVMAPTPERIILPHEKILEELAQLGMKKQWLNNEMKAYHIALTDILRRWVVERYSIQANEMTTREIVTALRNQRANESGVMHLERILRTADMVKFAKGIPSEEECEQNLRLAIQYVQQTAVYPSPQMIVSS